MELHLRGQSALVVGGASGIGLATARALISEGVRVVIWDRSEATPTLAQNLGDDHLGFAVDIADETAVLIALAATINVVGKIDHLVHAAAIGSGKVGMPFTNLKPADWQRVLQVNIMGMVYVAHAIAPLMMSRKCGTMAFVASVAGQIGSPTDPPYSASKAANINFAQCLARDLASYNIRVNSICPGMVATPLNRAVWQAWHDMAPAQERISYDEWFDRKVRAVVPLGKPQTPEAVADLIVFLASERAAHITGQTMNVDGGYVMHS